MIPVLVVGGCAVDEGYRAVAPSMTTTKMLETSVPCTLLFRSPGGVGRNLADVLRKLLPVESHAVSLLSAVGSDDAEGAFVLAKCRDALIATEPGVARLRGQSTAKYVAILDGKGSLATAAAAMSIFESAAFLRHIETVGALLIREAAAVVIDCNLPQQHFKVAFALASCGSGAAAAALAGGNSADGASNTASSQQQHRSGATTTSEKGDSGTAGAAAASSPSTSFLSRFFSSAASTVAAEQRARQLLLQHLAPPVPVKIIAIDPISTEKARRCVAALLEAAAAAAASSPPSSNAGGGGGDSNGNKQIQQQQRGRNPLLVTIMKPNNFEAAAMVEEVVQRVGHDRMAALLEALEEGKPALSSAEAADSSSSSKTTVSPPHRVLLPRNAHRSTGSAVLTSPPSSSAQASVQASNLAAAADANSRDAGSSGGSFSSHTDVCHTTLHEATRNAVLLSVCLRLDVVVVSCGQHGSIACFRSEDEEPASAAATAAAADSNQRGTSSESDTTVLRFGRNWFEIKFAAADPHPLAGVGAGRRPFSCFIRWFPPLRVSRVVKVTGAGDTFMGTLTSYLLLALTAIATTTTSTASSSLATTSGVSRLAGATEAAAHGEAAHFSNASLNAMLAAQQTGRRTWAALLPHHKGALLTSAVTRASINAIAALTTSSGATPALRPMVAATSTASSKL